MKAKFVTIPDSVLCVIAPEEPQKAWILGQRIAGLHFNKYDWIPADDSRFRPAIQQDFVDFRVSDVGYRHDPRYDFPMHPALEYFRTVHPQAVPEQQNARLYWQDDDFSHSITYFTTEERVQQMDLLEKLGGANPQAKVLWVNIPGGHLRFVTQPLSSHDSRQAVAKSETP